MEEEDPSFEAAHHSAILFFSLHRLGSVMAILHKPSCGSLVPITFCVNRSNGTFHLLAAGAVNRLNRLNSKSHQAL